MYRNILVPIDGSETANLGLEEAIRLAQSQGGRIRLVHIVNEFLPLAPTLYSANIVSVMETIRKAGESALEAAEAAVRRAGVEVDTRLVEAPGGQAGANVVEQAIEWPAELIVCGTHGRRGIRRVVLGSDAEYIVRRTPVPVLLVRSRESLGE